MNYTYLSSTVNNEEIKDIDYSQSNIGNNPTVNLATGRMQYIFNDVDVGSGLFAISIAHIYNSKLNKKFANKIIGLGSKWKLNLTQCVIPDNYDGKNLSILKYLDESGEIHRYVSFGTDKWYNDRKATSIIERIDGNYVLSDGVGNKLYFNSKGYLFKSVTCRNSDIAKVYTYDANDRLVSVCVKRLLQNTVAKNRIGLQYNSVGNLEKMIAYAQNTQPVFGYRYKYDSANNLVAVFKIAYGSQTQEAAEKQLSEFCYDENGNLTMVIDSETKAARLLQYDAGGKVIRHSAGFVNTNCIASGMTDSENNSLALSSSLKLGLSCCEADYLEKSYNTFNYRFNSSNDDIALTTEVTNECNITLRYYIDRKACITSSFECDKSFAKNGENLRTLTKYNGQTAPSADTASALGYINGREILASSNGSVSCTLDPTEGKIVQTSNNFNFSFWLKTKKNYEVLEVHASYKANLLTNEPSKEKTVFVNPQAAGAWQLVVIPIALPIPSGTVFYTIDLSLIANKITSTQYKDDFEINTIGLTTAPCAELMLAANGTNNLPLSALQKVKPTWGAFYYEINDIGADFFLTEADIISTYTNKYKSKTGTFDLIYNNGTKRRADLTDIYFYFPAVEWVHYTDNKPFYIHTALPVEPANIKTHYTYDNDGFVIKSDYFKTIDGKNYESWTSVRMDYTGKTIYETDEYLTTKKYQYDNYGDIKQISVSNGTVVQSMQKFEYDDEANLVSVDNGLSKQKVSFNEVSQSHKIKDYSYSNDVLTDTGHSLKNSIGIFRDKQLSVSEYSGLDEVGSIRLTYENGQIRTITDGLVRYGVRYNYLKDWVMYSQFDGQTERPIQLDSVTEYRKIDDKYCKTHISRIYDPMGHDIDGSAVDIDVYGKPLKLYKGSYTGNKTADYSYVYPDIQESEFVNKPSVCKNIKDNSATEYQYDCDGNLIGWKETESNKTTFEVRQIAPNATKYTFGNNEQEYFVHINHEKAKMAAPLIESIVVKEDKRDDVDKPTDMFQVDYKWTSLGNLDEIKTNISTEKHTYLTLHNNLLLANVDYSSKASQNLVTTTVNGSDNIQYYDNGLIKQETITNKEFTGGIIPVYNPVYTSVRTFQYDNLHRITKELNSGLNVSRTYSYYPNGRLKSIVGDKSSDVRRFVYDSKGRLASVNDSTTYAYDHFGNRISKTVNGVTSSYTFGEGGRLISAGGVKYSYNADGIRCKKTCIANGIGEKIYLDGGKILGEDRANCKLRYFYDATGLKRIRRIDKSYTINYECVKDSQGSIIMLIDSGNGGICCRYEYDALGKCTIVEQANNAGDINPFRWKGFFYDSETGFYYANGSYYDPETGLYVDAAPVSSVIENADSPRYIDRNGTLCYNPLAIAGSPYTAYPTVEMEEDPNYSPGQTWWEKFGKWVKFGIGILVIVGLAIATIATGGAAGGLAGAVCAGALKGAAIGAVSGAATSGIIGGIVSAYSKQGFWDGFVEGAADGFMFGAISGAIAGGASAYSNYGNFASADKLQSHFEDHGRGLGYASKTAYARDAKYVIRHGQKVTHIYRGKKSIGYIKFYGNKGHANYAFVGMNGKYTATFEVRSVEKLIEMGVELFGL